jgi:hypothetical protein
LQQVRLPKQSHCLEQVHLPNRNQSLKKVHPPNLRQSVKHDRAPKASEKPPRLRWRPLGAQVLMRDFSSLMHIRGR